MERELSFKADIINAFSGLCQAFTAIGHETFHWGLPVSRFDAALCWWLRAGGQRNYAFSSQVKDDLFVSSVPFPSWSWAAWHGSSARGWISWLDLERQSPEVTPEIIFYCQDTDGNLYRVMEVPAASGGLGGPPQENTKIENTVDLRREWKLPQQIVEVTSYKGPLNTGLLHFWTSTARLYVSRQHMPSGHDGVAYFLVGLQRDANAKVSSTQVSIDATTHVKFEKFKDIHLKSEIPEGVLPPSPPNQIHDIVVIHFVVVTKTLYNNELCALAVEWKDGIAYRIGLVHVKEEEWIGLRNREWKMVTFG